jgi:Rod binding domain-containing protein
MSNSIDTASAKSYLDFSGLGELRAKAQQNQDKALKETAQQFEGMFIQMMMKSMRDATETMKDEENESSARATFEDMFDREVSVQMSKRNALGVSDFLERAVKQRTPATADVLKARQDKGIPLHLPAQPMPLQPAAPQQGLPLEKPSIKTLKEVHMVPPSRSGS